MADWECIIIDDGSTDNTFEVADSYVRVDRRFRYHYQQNKGLSAARNVGIELAKGTFIQFLDADDLISEKKLSIQSAFMMERPDVQISYTEAFYFMTDKPAKLYRSFYFDENGRRQINMNGWIPQIDGYGVELLNRLVKGNIAPVHSMLTRKELITKVGGFDVSLECLEDWDFWLRCAFEGARFSYLDEQDAFVLVRVHDDSMSNDTFAMLLQHFRRLRDSEHEIKVRGISGVDLEAIDYVLAYRDNLRKLFRMIGFSNIHKLKQVAGVFGWRKFLGHYFSMLNRYRKGKL